MTASAVRQSDLPPTAPDIALPECESNYFKLNLDYTDYSLQEKFKVYTILIHKSELAKRNIMVQKVESNAMRLCDLMITILFGDIELRNKNIDRLNRIIIKCGLQGEWRDPALCPRLIVKNLEDEDFLLLIQMNPNPDVFLIDQIHDGDQILSFLHFPSVSKIYDTAVSLLSHQDRIDFTPGKGDVQARQSPCGIVTEVEESYGIRTFQINTSDDPLCLTLRHNIDNFLNSIAAKIEKMLPYETFIDYCHIAIFEAASKKDLSSNNSQLLREYYKLLEILSDASSIKTIDLSFKVPKDDQEKNLSETFEAFNQKLTAQIEQIQVTIEQLKIKGALKIEILEKLKLLRMLTEGLNDSDFLSNIALKQDLALFYQRLSKNPFRDYMKFEIDISKADQLIRNFFSSKINELIFRIKIQFKKTGEKETILEHLNNILKFLEEDNWIGINSELSKLKNLEFFKTFSLTNPLLKNLAIELLKLICLFSKVSQAAKDFGIINLDNLHIAQESAKELSDKEPDLKIKLSELARKCKSLPLTKDSEIPSPLIIVNAKLINVLKMIKEIPIAEIAQFTDSLKTSAIDSRKYQELSSQIQSIISGMDEKIAALNQAILDFKNFCMELLAEDLQVTPEVIKDIFVSYNALIKDYIKPMFLLINSFYNLILSVKKIEPKGLFDKGKSCILQLFPEELDEISSMRELVNELQAKPEISEISFSDQQAIIDHKGKAKATEATLAKTAENQENLQALLARIYENFRNNRLNPKRLIKELCKILSEFDIDLIKMPGKGSHEKLYLRIDGKAIILPHRAYLKIGTADAIRADLEEEITKIFIEQYA